MNYIGYHPIDVVNGEGTRASLFVSGCEHHCKGCFQKQSWREDAGFLFDRTLEDKIIADLTDQRIRRRGLSILGGEPMMSYNVPTLINLVDRIRNESPLSDIWLWTGYTIEALQGVQIDLAKKCDIIIDGRFELNLKDPALVWRGSSNQRVIKVKEYGW